MTRQNAAAVPGSFRADHPNTQLGQLADLINNLVIVVKLHTDAVAENQCGGIIHANRFMHPGVYKVVHLLAG